MMKNERSTNQENQSGETLEQLAPEGVDYLSHVPREVLHHILFFLPFQYWIILGMVSKQWKDLFRETPVLILAENEIVLKMRRQLYREHLRVNERNHHNQLPVANEDKRKFAEFVNHTVLSHSGCLIKHMLLSIQYEARTEYALNINNWVNFLMTRDIENLELNFSATPKLYYELHGLGMRRLRTPQSFELPCQPFEPKFRCFFLNFCKFKASRFGSFVKLKTLYLTDVNILDSSIGQLVSKCPILEDLYMERCVVSDNFFICQEDLNIKHLMLLNCLTEKWYIFPIDISTPQLINLVIIGNYLMRSTIRNATNLVDCSINIEQHYSDKDQGDFLGLMMINLKHCHSLALSSWCIQVLSTSNIGLIRQFKGAFNNLKSLKLTIAHAKEELPGIVLLLQTCPHLETLTLEIVSIKNINWLIKENGIFKRYIPEVFSFEGDTYLENQSGEDIPCLRKSLKVLHIHGFIGGNYVINLMRFLLGNALVLENIVVYEKWPEGGFGESAPMSRVELNQLRMLQTLQDIPRASSDVQVLLENVEESQFSSGIN